MYISLLYYNTSICFYIYITRAITNLVSKRNQFHGIHNNFCHKMWNNFALNNILDFLNHTFLSRMLQNCLWWRTRYLQNRRRRRSDLCQRMHRCWTTSLTRTALWISISIITITNGDLTSKARAPTSRCRLALALPSTVGYRCYKTKP